MSERVAGTPELMISALFFLTHSRSQESAYRLFVPTSVEYAINCQPSVARSPNTCASSFPYVWASCEPHQPDYLVHQDHKLLLTFTCGFDGRTATRVLRYSQSLVPTLGLGEFDSAGRTSEVRGSVTFMDWSVTITLLGVVAGFFGATVPLLLERSDLRRLERLDAIAARTSRRGGENSLLRAARDRIALRVGLGVLAPKYAWARFAGGAGIAAGFLYVALGALMIYAASTTSDDASLPWTILAMGLGFLVFGAFFLLARAVARWSGIRELHELHNLSPVPDDDLTSWLIQRVAIRVRNSKRRGFTRDKELSP